jgi:hypothetical protein
MIPPKVIENLKSMRDNSYSDAMKKVPQFVCSLSIDA